MVQDVPISIQAFTADQLDAKGIDQPAKLQTATPGLVYDGVGNFAVIYLRGVGTDAFIPSADLSIATYIDGVYFPFSINLADRAFGPVQRIEVLKGPQGTLFGRNSTGGAINITTKEPADHFVASAGLTLARYDERDSKAFISGPITDSLSASLALTYDTKDEYYSFSAGSPQYGKDLQSYFDKGVNAKIKWSPTECLDATASGFYLKTQGSSSDLFVQLKPSPLGTALGVTANTPNYQTSVDTPTFNFSEIGATSLTVNVHPGPLDIKSITAYQDFNAQQFVDFDGSDKAVVSFGGSKSDAGPVQIARAFTQEFQFISNREGWLSEENIQWIFGLYFIKSTGGLDPINFDVAGLNDILGSQGNLPVPLNVPFYPELKAALAAAPILKLGGNPQISGRLDTHAYAAYTQETWSPLSWFDATIGARVQQEKRTVYKADLGILTTEGDQQSYQRLITYADKSLDQTNFSPKVSLSFKPAGDVLIYSSYQKAFKSGSFNIINLTSPPTEIKPEKVSTAELGIKSETFGHALRLNASVFDTVIRDLQSQFLSLISGGVVQFQNADKATIKGADFEMQWIVTQALVLNANATYLDGKYNKFINGNGFDPTTGLFTSNLDFSGNRIVRNPKFSATAGADYSYGVGDGVVEFGADVYYNSGYFYDAQNATKQDSYYSTSARASYLYDPWKLRITAFGDNLNSAKHYIFKFTDDFGTVGKLSPPIVYGIRLGWEF